jgi:hypothetical protein
VRRKEQEAYKRIDPGQIRGDFEIAFMQFLCTIYLYILYRCKTVTVCLMGI